MFSSAVSFSPSAVFLSPSAVFRGLGNVFICCVLLSLCSLLVTLSSLLLIGLRLHNLVEILFVLTLDLIHFGFLCLELLFKVFERGNDVISMEGKITLGGIIGICLKESSNGSLLLWAQVKCISNGNALADVLLDREKARTLASLHICNGALQ